MQQPRDQQQIELHIPGVWQNASDKYATGIWKKTTGDENDLHLFQEMDYGEVKYVDGMSESHRTRSTGKVRRESPVWKYFTSRGQESAQCNLCEKSVKRSCGSTSNLIQHLKRAHQKEYADVIGEHGRRSMEAATRMLVCHVL